MKYMHRWIHDPRWGQIIRFLIAGIAGYVVYAVFFLALRLFLMVALSNLIALIVSTLANTQMNRQFTFGIKGKQYMARHHLQGLILLLVTWVLSSLGIGALHLFVDYPSAFLEVIVGIVSTALITAVKFVVMRKVIFA